MAFEYTICDVFTSQVFGGNPLAVIHDARGLSQDQMQRIAREFNFSETSFVFPAERGGSRKVRIFTPSREVPFAGHPNVGTACVLASLGQFGSAQQALNIVFEEQAGDVAIQISPTDEGLFLAQIQAPETLQLGASIDPTLIADALEIQPQDLDLSIHPAIEASVGLGFLIVRVGSPQVLAKLQPDSAGFHTLAQFHDSPFVHAYCLAETEHSSLDIRSRMFAPTDAIPEDPATGSANCALAALLAHYHTDADGDFSWRIAQGVEMGRPSELLAGAQKRAGEVVSSTVAGTTVMVSRGELFL